MEESFLSTPDNPHKPNATATTATSTDPPSRRLSGPPPSRPNPSPPPCGSNRKTRKKIKPFTLAPSLPAALFPTHQMARDLPGATASWRRLAHTLASHTSRRACANHHQSAAGAASATILRSARGPLRSTARWRLERGGPSRASLPCLPGGRRYYSGGGYGGSPNWYVSVSVM